MAVDEDFGQPDDDIVARHVENLIGSQAVPVEGEPGEPGGPEVDEDGIPIAPAAPTKGPTGEGLDAETDTAQGGRADGQTAPVSAVQKERRKRQLTEQERGEIEQEALRLRDENAAFRDREARMDERLRMVAERNRAEQAAREQAEQDEKIRRERPDPEIDPVGAELWDRRRETEELRASHDEIRQNQAQEAQLRVRDAVIGASRDAVNHYTSTHPYYSDAFTYLWRSRDEELSLAEPDPGSRAAIIENEKGMIVAMCYGLDQRTGQIFQKRHPDGRPINPGEVIDRWAQLRGFRPPGAAAADNGARVARPAGARQPARESFERVRRGVEDSRGVGAGTASGGARAVTFQTLANMTPAQIVELQLKNPELIDAAMEEYYASGGR